MMCYQILTVEVHAELTKNVMLRMQVHLIYDLQLMMSGKSVQVSPDEYISCALSIFLDIINIFLMILTILGASGVGSNN